MRNGPADELNSKRWQLMLAVVCMHVFYYKTGRITLFNGAVSLKQKSGKLTVCYQEMFSALPRFLTTQQRPQLCCLRDLFFAHRDTALLQ